MKKIIRFCLLQLLALCNCLFLFGQQNDTTVTISDVFNNPNNNYFQIIGTIEGEENEVFNRSSDAEKKRYNRMRTYWDTRIDSNGDFATYVDQWKNYYPRIQNTTNKTQSTFTLSWEHLGPFEMSSLKN